MKRPAAFGLAFLLAALAAGDAAAWDFRCGCLETPAPLGPAATFRLGAGIFKPAFGVRAGFGWLWERGQLGLEVELNPYFTLERVDLSLGSFNAAVTGGLRLRMNQGVTLRFEAGLGVGVLLFDAYGYPPGTPGLYLGARALGLDLDFGRRVLVGIDLVDLSLVAFRITDMPYLYPQWRVSVSITLVQPRARPAEPTTPGAEPDEPGATAPAETTDPAGPVEPAPPAEPGEPPATARRSPGFDSRHPSFNVVESRVVFQIIVSRPRSESPCTPSESRAPSPPCRSRPGPACRGGPGA